MHDDRAAVRRIQSSVPPRERVTLTSSEALRLAALTHGLAAESPDLVDALKVDDDALPDRRPLRSAALWTALTLTLLALAALVARPLPIASAVFGITALIAGFIAVVRTHRLLTRPEAPHQGA